MTRRQKILFSLLYFWNFVGMCRMNWISFLSFGACAVITCTWILINTWKAETDKLKLEIEDMLFNLLGGVIGRN